MSSRKEDEKNERIIRNLLKLPDNRRCINCNSLGPQYVCVNFWTFVCTNCSGIHREFTHRVKSISMAKFTSQEVSALQGGGNSSAKEIYLKEWDPQRQSLPDGSNVERLRDFIKHVYVERRYSGERIFEKPPRVKGESEDSQENRRIDSFQSGSRSPPYDDERRYSDRPSPGGRSPGYDQDHRQYDKRSPARTEVVNDWRREDRFGNGRRLEDVRVSDGGSKLDGRSPDRQRDIDASSPPVVRPVRDILGENVSPLRVLEPPKANGPRAADGSTRTQRTASSSSLASSNGNPAEIKIEASLIDFDAAPEPPVPAVVQPQQSAASTSTTQIATPSTDNWANFDSVAEVKASQPPVSSNPLESVLAQLSVPASVSGHVAVTPGIGNASVGTLSSFPNVSPVTSFGAPFGNAAPASVLANNSTATLTGNPAAAPAPGPVASLPIPGGNSFGNVVPGGQWPQPQPYSSFPAVGGQPLSHPLTSASVGPTSNQPWNPLFAPNAQVPPGAANVQASQAVLRPGLDASTGVATQNSQEAKSSGRRELPEDLFTFSYPSMPVRVPGWHGGPAHGMMGFNMQYNMPMPMQPTFAQVSKSTNPFDVNADPSPAAPFPSMASLQGALPPSVAAAGLLRTSSLGTPSAHPSALLANGSPYVSIMPSNTNVMQQLPGNMQPRPHGQVSYGIEGGAFGTLSSNQQLSALQSVPTAPNTFSSIGGNPFG